MLFSLRRIHFFGQRVLGVSVVSLGLLGAGCGQGTCDGDKLDQIEARYRQYERSFAQTPAVTVEELLKARGPTTRVHVYGRKWSLLPAGYEAVW